MLLERKAAQILSKSKKSLSIAESCSGGLLGHRLTNIPGSSRFLLLDVIAYSNQAKQKILGVPASVLKKHGAVSDPVARQMAEHVRRISRSDFGIGITGIAGPGGGTKQKPVGLVFIAVTGENFTASKKFLLKGRRSQVKMQATTQALKFLINRIKT